MREIMRMERLCHVDQWTAENFVTELQRPFTLSKGLWLGHSLVGLSLSWILPPECHLLNLMVHPSLWGRGLGYFLMRDLIQASKDSKAYKIILEVKVGNDRAERLYKRLGFTSSGVRKAYYSDGSNALTMTLELPAPPGTPQANITRRAPKPPSWRIS
jgi:ribosomal-protein-alanine N-acetyltransferase